MQTRNSNWAYIFQVTCIAMKNYNWRHLHLRILQYTIQWNLIVTRSFDIIIHQGIIIVLKLITLMYTVDILDSKRVHNLMGLHLVTLIHIIVLSSNLFKSSFPFWAKIQTYVQKRSMCVYKVCNCALHKAFQLPHICEISSFTVSKTWLTWCEFLAFHR